MNDDIPQPVPPPETPVTPVTEPSQTPVTESTPPEPPVQKEGLGGIISTIFVYGIVALIIKLDDIGFYLQEKKSETSKAIGTLFVKSMPYIIKVIGVVGTIAMLAVGGGIIVHETHMLHSFDNIIKSIPMGGFLSEIIIGTIIFNKVEKSFMDTV